eukprot:15455826-Alexandrium_andersonii.AAC.1
MLDSTIEQAKFEATHAFARWIGDMSKSSLGALYRWCSKDYQTPAWEFEKPVAGSSTPELAMQ